MARRRRRRTAAARRAQAFRAQERTIQRWLRAQQHFDHRGCRPTLMAQAMKNAVESLQSAQSERSADTAPAMGPAEEPTSSVLRADAPVFQPAKQEQSMGSVNDSPPNSQEMPFQQQHAPPADVQAQPSAGWKPNIIAEWSPFGSAHVPCPSEVEAFEPSPAPAGPAQEMAVADEPPNGDQPAGGPDTDNAFLLQESVSAETAAPWWQFLTEHGGPLPVPGLPKRAPQEDPYASDILYPDDHEFTVEWSHVLHEHVAPINPVGEWTVLPGSLVVLLHDPQRFASGHTPIEQRRLTGMPGRVKCPAKGHWARNPNAFYEVEVFGYKKHTDSIAQVAVTIECRPYIYVLQPHYGLSDISDQQDTLLRFMAERLCDNGASRLLTLKFVRTLEDTLREHVNRFSQAKRAK